MSDIPETSEPEDRKAGVPPVFLLAGFLIVATAGSAIFILPADQQPITVSSTMTVPIGESNTTTFKPSVDAGGSGQTSSAEELPVTKTPSDSVGLIVEPKDLETGRFARLLIGDWRQEYYGERTLSVKADGTATMIIVPGSVWAVAFGNRIDLTMFWSVENGHLDYGFSGGTPADKVKLAASTWGDHWVEKIIALDGEQLDLLSVDGSTHSIWKRVSADSKSPSDADAGR